MPEIQLSYRPLDIYAPAHSSSARVRLLFGGFGTGKSMALCADAITRALLVPGLRICLSRVTVPELRDTLEPTFFDVLPPELLQSGRVLRAGGHVERFVFPNGSVVLFRQIDDWQKHKSLNLALWYPDELSEFDEGTFNGMSGRTRQVELTPEARELGYTGTVPEWVRGVMGASNPNGHDWMWRRFVDEPERRSAHWVGTSLDNPHLPEDYLRTLLAMPESWVKRYVLSSFDDFGGLVYPEWGEATHVYRGPLDITQRTPAWMGLDPGTRHPTAGLWTVVHRGALVAVREHLAQGLSVPQHVARFRALETGLPPVTWRVADPNSINVRDRGSAVSLKRQYAQLGYHFQDGPSSHQDRIPMLGALVKAGKFLGSDRTPLFNAQMQEYQWEQLTAYMKRKLGGSERAEDYGPERPVKANDDLVDAAQYLSSRMVPSPKTLRPPPQRPRTEAEVRSEVVRETILRQRRRRALQSNHDMPGVVV